MSIEIKENLLTNSPCYRDGRRITPAGGMLHSIGCPQPDPKVIANNFSVSTGACVHAVVGKAAVVLQLFTVELPRLALWIRFEGKRK